MAEPEYIGGYEVHPAASIFPLIEGDDSASDSFFGTRGKIASQVTSCEEVAV